MLSFILYELSSRRGAIIGWGLGLSAFVLIYSVAYPSIAPAMATTDFVDSPLFQAIAQFDMATFEGYFASTILNYMALLIAIYAVTNGTGALAGEEESGVLELMVTLPLHRWQIVLSKAIAMSVAALLILAMAALASMLAFVAVESQIETGVTALDLVPAVLNAWPITMVFMMMALVFSALLPQRRTAAAMATLVLVVSFFGSNLLPMVEGLAPLAGALPFHYFERSVAVFTEGVQPGDVIVLLGAALVLLLLAVLAFERRNLTVGTWFWRRARAAR
jgi:ABC-2 type transport system permease protein